MSLVERVEKHVHNFELSNGLRVVLFRRPQAPVFAGQVWVKVGGVNEVPGSTGISHMLEHMAFKGTTKIGTKNYQKEKVLLAKLEEVINANPDDENILENKEYKSIQDELKKLWVDGDFTRIYQNQGAVGLNAGTSKDYTVYTVELPKVAFELWCWMESERFVDPVFRQFYKEREVVLEERRMRTDDDPGGKLYEHLLATAYLAHPNRLPVIGWPTDLRRLTATQIAAFYKQYYRADNMVISIVGDLDVETIKPVLEKYFARIPAGDGEIPQVTLKEPKQVGERTVAVEFDAHPQFILAYHKPIHPHPADAAFTLMHELLANNRSSVMDKELVQTKKIATSVYTSEAPGELFPSLFVVGAQPTTEVDVESLRDEIQEILNRMKTQSFSDEALAGAKRRIKVSFFESLSTNDGLARMLGRSELLWGDWRELLRFYDGLNEVTSEDIKQTAKEFLNKENRTFAYIKRK